MLLVIRNAKLETFEFGVDMAAHDVDITVPTLELGRADVVFGVKEDSVTLGALHVSRGAVVWFPAGNTFGYKLDWAKLAGLIVEHGVRRETR